MPNSNNIKDALIKNNTMIANELNKTFAKRSDVNELASNKVDKVSGKGLSTNDYTTDEKNKLAGIESGAQKNPTTLSQLSDDSTHRLVTDTEKTTWNGKQNVLTFDTTPTALSDNPVTSSGIKTYVDNGIDDVWMHKSRSVGISCATITGQNNSIFNSVDASVSKTFGYYDEYCGIQNLYGDSVDFRDLRIGDTVLITETNVPDRWLASVEYSSDYSTITYTFKTINTSGINAQVWDSNEEVERDIIDFDTNEFEIKLHNHSGNDDTHQLIMNTGSNGGITLSSDFGTDAPHNQLQIERGKVTLEFYHDNEGDGYISRIKEGWYATDSFGMDLLVKTDDDYYSRITLNNDNINIFSNEGDISIGSEYSQVRLVGYGGDGTSSILTLGNSGNATLAGGNAILRVSQTNGLQVSNNNGQTWHDVALTDDAKSRLVKVNLINVDSNIRTNISLTFVVYNQSTKITSLAALLAANYVFIDGVYITDDESSMTEYAYYEPVVNISSSSSKMSIYCYTYGHDQSYGGKTHKNCTVYSVTYSDYSVTVTDTI